MSFNTAGDRNSVGSKGRERDPQSAMFDEVLKERPVSVRDRIRILQANADEMSRSGKWNSQTHVRTPSDVVISDILLGAMNGASDGGEDEDSCASEKRDQFQDYKQHDSAKIEKNFENAINRINRALSEEEKRLAAAAQNQARNRSKKGIMKGLGRKITSGYKSMGMGKSSGSRQRKSSPTEMYGGNSAKFSYVDAKDVFISGRKSAKENFEFDMSKITIEQVCPSLQRMTTRENGTRSPYSRKYQISDTQAASSRNQSSVSTPTPIKTMQNYKYYFTSACKLVGSVKGETPEEEVENTKDQDCKPSVFGSFTKKRRAESIGDAALPILQPEITPVIAQKRHSSNSSSGGPDAGLQDSAKGSMKLASPKRGLANDAKVANKVSISSDNNNAFVIDETMIAFNFQLCADF